MTAREATSGYLLCCSPRSGSTLLCDLLTRSGAGAPESYFRPASIPHYAKAWGLELGAGGWDLHYAGAVRRHGEAGTGVFGMRIMWSDMPAFLDRLANLSPGAGSSVQLLRSRFGIEHFIRLSRTDKVAQAVSLVMATQTGVWHRNADGTVRQGSADAASPRYDRAQIAAELEMLEKEQRGWDTWFATNSIVPLDLTYEALAVDPLAETRAILSHIGCASDEIPDIGTAKLSTSRNDAWIRRFRSNPAPHE